MTDAEKIAMIADILDAEGLTPETTLDSLEWDSMAMLSIVALARKNGKKVTGTDVRAMTTVGDIVAAI